MTYKTTKDIKISSKIVDQVIGQEDAVEIIKKAARQRRHVVLIGDPGTGKSMLGLALAELLPKEKLTDTLSFFNPNDDIVDGYNKGLMLSYEGLVSDEEIGLIIEYLRHISQ